MLTHRNILANVDAIGQVFELDPNDVLARRAAVLPLVRLHRHALAAGSSAASASSTTPIRWTRRRSASWPALPRDVLISTPTFCASYMRKCQPEQFAHLRYAIVGAEKLREPIADRVQGEVRRRPARRLRLHRDVAGRRGQRAGRQRWRGSARRRQVRNGRPSAARRRGEDRRSRLPARAR